MSYRVLEASSEKDNGVNVYITYFLQVTIVISSYKDLTNSFMITLMHVLKCSCIQLPSEFVSEFVSCTHHKLHVAS